MKTRIMVVDDSETERFIFSLVLKKINADLEHIEAANGQEALELLKTSDTHPDFIFLDLNMPIMDGFEFLEEITTKHHINSKVVVVSSSYREDDIKRSTSYPIVCDYIAKPINISALTDTINIISAAN